MTSVRAGAWILFVLIMREYCLLHVIVSLCLHADLEMLGIPATLVGMD
jgi:hypothetical protein